MATTVVERRFGTDLSNTRKTSQIEGKKPRSLVAKKAANVLASTDPENLSAISSSKSIVKDQKLASDQIVVQSLPSDQVVPIKNDPVGTIEEEKAFEQEVSDILVDSDPAKSKFLYNRDFLLSFKDHCTQPIEGLLPEVTRGYVDTPRPQLWPKYAQNQMMNRLISQQNRRVAEMNSTSIINASTEVAAKLASPSKSPIGIVKKTGSHRFIFTAAPSSPSSTTESTLSIPSTPSATQSPVASDDQPMDSPPTPLKSEKPVSEAKVESGTVDVVTEESSPTKTIVEDSSPKEAGAPPHSSESKAGQVGDESELPTKIIALQWRAKPSQSSPSGKKEAGKEKPRETDPRRIAQRQKQIDIGMNTLGYKRFCELVPEDKRTKEHPRIPDIHQKCSKRSWDGQVRKWRRMLHQYDPSEPQTDVDLVDDEVEIGDDSSNDEQ